MLIIKNQFPKKKNCSFNLKFQFDILTYRKKIVRIFFKLDMLNEFWVKSTWNEVETLLGKLPAH